MIQNPHELVFKRTSGFVEGYLSFTHHSIRHSAFTDYIAGVVRKALARRIVSQELSSVIISSKASKASSNRQGKAFTLSRKYNRAFPLQDLVRLPG